MRFSKYCLFAWLLAGVSLMGGAWAQAAKNEPPTPPPNYPEKRLKVLLEQIKTEASQGDREAQVAWSALCRDGLGVSADSKEAARWAWTAAKQDYWKAYETLIDLLNREAFIQRVTEDAEGGDATAQYYLGCLYEYGIAYEQSDTKAFDWYSKAAQQKHVKALRQLGKYYERRGGVFYRPKEAYKSYAVSAKLGDSQAQTRLAWIYITGIAGFLKRDENKALEQLKLAAPNYSVAQYNQTRFYTEPEFNQRVLWQREDGSAESMYRWTWILLEGVREKRNFSEAFKWLQRAANKGTPEVICLLGALTENGIGTKLNDTEAYKIYLKAAEKGHKPSIYAVFSMWAEGRGVPKQNYTEALKWLRKLGVLDSLDMAQQLTSELAAEYLFEGWDPYRTPTKP